MALVDDREAPDDVPTTDAIADMDAPDALDAVDVRMSGKTMTSLVKPPGRGEDVVLMVRLRVTGEGVDYPEDEDADERPFVKTRLVSCWRPGQKEPQPAEDVEKKAKADAKGKGLYDEPELPYGGEDPEQLGDALGRGIVRPEVDEDTSGVDDGEPEDDGDDAAVYRPDFSDRSDS